MTYKSIIENNLLQLIEELTNDTKGKIINTTQLDIIIQTIGRIFLWDSINKEKSYSIEYVKEYIYSNMSEYSEDYYSLIEKLTSSLPEDNLIEN